MTEGSRVHSRQVRGTVSSAAHLYTLADQISGIVLRSVPDARPGHGMLYLSGVAEFSGPEILSQLTAEERELEPALFLLPFRGSGIDVTFSNWLMGQPIGYEVTVKGADEVRVIGLAEKLGKEVTRLVEKIESGQSLPAPVEPSAKAIASKSSGDGPQSRPTAASTAETISPTPATKAAVLRTPDEAKSGAKRFAENPYTIAIATGVIVWIITNLPVVAAAAASTWALLVAQPWFAQVMSILISVGAAILAAVATMAVGNRKRSQTSGS